MLSAVVVAVDWCFANESNDIAVGMVLTIGMDLMLVVAVPAYIMHFVGRLRLNNAHHSHLSA